MEGCMQSEFWAEQGFHLFKSQLPGEPWTLTWLQNQMTLLKAQSNVFPLRPHFPCWTFEISFRDLDLNCTFREKCTILCSLHFAVECSLFLFLFSHSLEVFCLFSSFTVLFSRKFVLIKTIQSQHNVEFYL